MDSIKDALDEIGDAVDLSAVITIIAIILGAWICLMVVRHFIKNAVSGLQGDTVQKGLHIIRRRAPKAFLNSDPYVVARRQQRAATIGAILRSLTTIVIVVIASFLILGQLSVELGPFIAGTAILTAALGFGAQYVVRDFLAGFFIVVEDQYGVGDRIELGEISGVVESVSLRITRLRGTDGTLWHIPNGEIKQIGNKSQAKGEMQ